ncbi:hypothetical protein GobsT_62810 [Gemmata obscuriglobus]|uniref:DUF1559 domain-containing protein n=1 Tax=Gemmata obscuriglobus TaxID=114 RepID=A0A2Z3GWN9_9BACT|nr:hypothetical protein [Gemmata obscuriglobus]AWM35977.1 hypothetical protein C1280_02420 [Gemmata obscuriglobus]QEG31459.1 hypothetical protein GobsT_62810 [Gemmata obscuriglobus]VTS10801.1 Uncharacterized protein OS=Myxococcus sp. (contaminant ex DSM 436) GN=A176_01026 PE=4 SV=1 [Gemmata obscuriglobus UQM 2246]
MPIRFRCPGCTGRLSIAARKAGTAVVCPNCGAAATVPGAEPETAPDPERREVDVPPRGARTALAATVAAVLLCAGVALVLFVALRKPGGRAGEQARSAPRAESQPAAAQVAPEPPSVARPAPNAPIRAAEAQPPAFTQGPVPQPHAPQPQAVPQSQISPQPQPAVPSLPQPPVPAPPQRAPLDRFGNPVGPEYGLARDGEFKGTKILFWCAFQNAGNVFFGPTNPLWKALEDKGFVVRRAFGRFDPRWLKEADQLWVVSSGRLELPAGVTPELLVEAMGLLPAGAAPSGLTPAEYQFIVRATLDVAFSPRHALDERGYAAIEAFVRAGKGLCLLADDEPFTAEADELARRLFGARVSGNYHADKIAAVRGRGLTPAEVRRFGGQFEVEPHPLLTGVNFLFEGITVSHVGPADGLEAALAASDGKTLLAVSKVPGRRVVIDCGFTRYCHGPTERTSYIVKTPGTVRLGQNVAAYLAGKGAPKGP